MDLRDLLEFQPEGGVLRFGGERVLLMDSTALGLLRKDITETFGTTAAKGLLTRFGFAHGWRLGESLSRQVPLGSELAIWPYGGYLHQLLGLVIPHLDQETEDGILKATWVDSYEVEQQLTLHGLAEDSVCWTLCGFASGWLSFFRGEKVYCLEESCRGRGDAACVMIAKSAGQWEPEYATDLAAYDKVCLDESLKRLTYEIKQTESRIQKIRNRVIMPDHRPVVKSPAMCGILDMAERLAKTDTTVLLAGESGSGKELMAKFIHEQSLRSQRPFVAVNCGALPENLLESELFGHVRGAFTGASQARVGLFEAAQGGTLFLDEVGDMTPSTQVKVLRALQEREIRRVGENTSRPVDVRVLAATNRDLTAEMAAGRFRQDLYYRLRVVELVIPPLRERVDDILSLARYFLEEGGKRLKKEMQGFEPAAAHQLLRYSWPGNVRELRNAIERAVALSPGPKVGLEDLPDEIRKTVTLSNLVGSDLSLDEFEKAHILAVLQSVQWNRGVAAQKLEISPATLFRKLQRYTKETGKPGEQHKVGGR